MQQDLQQVVFQHLRPVAVWQPGGLRDLGKRLIIEGGVAHLHEQPVPGDLL